MEHNAASAFCVTDRYNPDFMYIGFEKVDRRKKSSAIFHGTFVKNLDSSGWGDDVCLGRRME